MADPYFRVPLDLPHAGTIALRLARHLARLEAIDAVRAPAHELVELLQPHRISEENPPEDEAEMVVLEAARLGRLLVTAIAAARIADDRLGQSVRNLFECLELGAEGARLSLAVGEHAHSPLRPTRPGE